MMAFHTFNFDDRGEYNYSSTPYYSTCYEIVPFQQSSSSSNYESKGYDIVPFQYSSTLNYQSINSYDIVPYQDSSPTNYETNSSFYSTNEYTEPNFFEYSPNSYNNAYDPFYIEPKLLQYNPIFYNTHNFSPDTQFIISYSNAPLVDDTDYDDYDPTPYDGGYDIAQTYGKPLKPSDQICYPRSVPEPDIVSSIDSSYGSIPSPYGKPENGIKKVPISDPILEKEKPIIVNEVEKPLELSEGGSNCDDGEMRGDYGNYGNVSYDKPAVQFQGAYGYGLEAMDLCEGLFGYWPCLDKKIRRECENCEQVVSDDDQWKSAANYLFASPYTYYGDGVENYQYHNYN